MHPFVFAMPWHCSAFARMARTHSVCMQGALLVLIGNTSAAVFSFFLSRVMGAQLANKIQALEGGEEQQNVLMAQLQGVQDAIDSGGFCRQYTAMLLLRLTPVVPYR